MIICCELIETAKMEESRLIVAVNRFGIRSWSRISREVRTRSSIECRNRWRWIIYIACMLLQINRNISSNAIPRRTRRLRAINNRQLTRFRNNIQNPASNSVPSRRDIRMTLDYILN
ncbi:hypothetical protein C1645_803415 [Glomus cerebriforme]|uniref:Uncharacterized protein n=1 Tax=Glomus cerebriforme TaxID=658196 RepID=A0A397TE19_9GLOM|nr:hypothetical protein C1645_803415 [Glomus cerebriforme]